MAATVGYKWLKIVSYPPSTQSKEIYVIFYLFFKYTDENSFNNFKFFHPQKLHHKLHQRIVVFDLKSEFYVFLGKTESQHKKIYEKVTPKLHHKNPKSYTISYTLLF